MPAIFGSPWPNDLVGTIRGVRGLVGDAIEWINEKFKGPVDKNLKFSAHSGIQVCQLLELPEPELGAGQGLRPKANELEAGKLDPQARARD